MDKAYQQLTTSDLRKLLRECPQYHAAKSLRELVAIHIKLTAKLIATDLHGFSTYNSFNSGNFWRHFSDPVAEKILIAYAPVYLDYLKNYPAESKKIYSSKNKGIVNCGEVFSHPRYEEIGFWDNYLRPIGFKRHLVYTLRDPDQFASFFYYRKAKAFSTREIAIVKILSQHIEQAYQNLRLKENLERENQYKAKEQEALAVGSIWLNAHLNILSITAPARKLLEEFFPPAHFPGELPAPLLTWIQTCYQHNSKSHSPQAFFRKAFATTLIAHWTITAPSGEHLILLQRRREPKIEDIARLGLTQRESEVLLWLAQGKTNEEIAQILGAACNTINKHVQHVFTKLKLENRSAAIRLVTEALY